MNMESFPQSNQENTGPKAEKRLERARKLNQLRQAMGRFMLAGVVFFGAEMTKYHPDSSSLSLAEIIEMTGQEEREWISGFIQEGKLEGKPEILHDLEARNGKIGKDTIKSFVNSMPQNWVDGEVSVIANAGIENYEAVIYMSGAIATFSWDGKEVEFHPEAKKESRSYLFHALAHELSHGNDFLFDSDLDWTERHHLFESISRRISEENHFKTNYIMVLKDLVAEDPQNTQERFRLIQEYWAEICAQYFVDPVQLDIEDFELVHEFVLKNDPNYNWKTQLTERQKISGRGTTEHIVEK